MELLAIILVLSILAILVLSALIIAVEFDIAKKWEKIFKGKGRD